MLTGNRPSIAIVTRKTRLEGLKARWGTFDQAKFRMKQARLSEIARRKHDIDDDDLMEAEEEADAIAVEADRYSFACQAVMREIDLGMPISRVEREFVPNFDFSRCIAVVVVGQDGLVANTAKYVGDIPIIGVNPDPMIYDGVLLPYQIGQVRRAVQAVLDDRVGIRQVSLAEAKLQDGQTLLGFNDLFIGSASHVSARYQISVANTAESQSSSGILVSTGAGSTGWLSSVRNMVRAIATFDRSMKHVRVPDPTPEPIAWEERSLRWLVREPFVSRTSSANLVVGVLEERDEIVIESKMPENGVIFSDGVEQDYLPFNSGTIARIRVAERQAKLVWPF